MATEIGTAREIIKGTPVSKKALPLNVRLIFFSNKSEEATKGRHSSTVSFPIIRAGITIEWRRKVHQSEGMDRALRPAGIHSIHRISLMLSPTISSCWPRLPAVSRSLGSSGLVGRDLRNGLKLRQLNFPSAENQRSRVLLSASPQTWYFFFLLA